MHLQCLSAQGCSAAGNFYGSVVVPNPFQPDLDIVVTDKAPKLFSPLYEENAVFRDQVVETQGFQLAGRINPIQIDMIEIRPRTPVLVHQGERGAGDIFFRSGLEGGGNSLNERGFARTQIA